MIRWSGALWFLPVLFGLGSLHAVNSLSTRSGYTVSDVASTSYVIYMLCPLLAGFAAYGFRGWARFHGSVRSRRSGLRVVLNAWFPLLVGGPLVVLVTILVSSWSLPTDSMTWQVLAIDVVTALACVLVGMAAGWAFPVVVAAPVVSFALFVWIAYLPSTGNETFHHLTPTLTGCCAQSVQPSGVAVRAILLLTGTVCVGVLGMLVSRAWSRTPRPLVAALLVGAIVMGVGLASVSLTASGEELKLTTVEPRETPLSCSVARGIRVCSWPEGRSRAGEIAGVGVEMNRQFREWGFPEITEIGTSMAGGDVVAVESTPSLRGRHLGFSLAKGYVRLHLDCPKGGRDVVDQRVAFLALTIGGAGVDELTGEFSPEIIRVAAEWADKTNQSGPLSAWFFDEDSAFQCRSDS